MRMILIAAAVAIFSFITIYFVSDMGYEISISKVETDHEPAQKRVEQAAPLTAPATVSPPVEQPVLQDPFPTAPTALPHAVVDPSVEAERKKHVAELQAIQRDMSQLHGADGRIDIDRLEHAVDRFSDLDQRAPELGIGKIINAGKLQQLVVALRGINRLQLEITALTKDPENIDVEKMNAKLRQLQEIQAEMMRVLPHIRPQAPPASP